MAPFNQNIGEDFTFLQKSFFQQNVTKISLLKENNAKTFIATVIFEKNYTLLQKFVFSIKMFPYQQS